MINLTPETLRSLRTLSAAEVDARARERAKFDLSPTDRMHNVCRPHATYGGARH